MGAPPFALVALDPEAGAPFSDSPWQPGEPEPPVLLVFRPGENVDREVAQRVRVREAVAAHDADDLLLLADEVEGAGLPRPDRQRVPEVLRGMAEAMVAGG